MFQTVCKRIREPLFGIKTSTDLENNQINFGNGTGFLIAENVIVTASHVIHRAGNVNEPIHGIIQVIRAPEVGNQMTNVEVLADFPQIDIAFLKADIDASIAPVKLLTEKKERGEQVGFLGFPLAGMMTVNQKLVFSLTERFQSGFISAVYAEVRGGRTTELYETDSSMYSGSSGCPGFDINGDVFGVHVATKGDRNQKGENARLSIAIQIASTEIIRLAEASGIRIHT